MLRVSSRPMEGGTVVLELEGRLVGPWLDLLREVCEGHRSSGEAVVLDLSGVDWADPSGVELLRQLLGQGVNCVSWSPFLERLVWDRV